MRYINNIALFTLFISAISAESLSAQNKSLEFNGTNNKVVIANHSDFDFITQFTLEAWIYANNWKDQTWQGSIISKEADHGGTQTGYILRMGSNGRMEGVVTPGWGGAATGAVMKEKKWNHVAMVFKDGEMWLYVNGTQQAYKGSLPDSINTSPVDLVLGESSGFPGRAWDGRIDEVRIWDTARTAIEILQNMSISLQGTESGLVAYYNFDEDVSSNTLTDQTSNGHNGALTNFGSAYTWTDGYELSQNDIAITGIINPGNNPVWSNSERIKVEIKNTAFNNVSNFDVGFIYGDHIYTETISKTIEPFHTYIHTFDKFIDLKSKDVVALKAYVSWDNDTDPDNDTLEQSFEKTNSIRLMDRVQHNAGDKGQSHSNIVTLPDDNSIYSQLLLHVSVACPGTGCDPWDQPGNVKIKKDDKEYEIGRFVTPYKKACGPWTIDVSDFRSILTGTVDVISFIQVWGSSGWSLTLDLEYVEGDLDKPYTQIIPLYELERQVYGDSAISYDLPEQSVFIPANSQAAQIRMTNTGHGQANTQNAAEFMEANHHMWVNGVDKFTHHLWKDDCNQNSCSPQSGTWEFARAGWCPGQQVNPAWFNITDVLTPGDDMIFDYVLQDYTNLLNTGYNGGSHTEPFYKIYSYLFLASNAPFDNYTDLAIDSIDLKDASTAGAKKVYLELTNKGSLNIENAQLAYVINNSGHTTETTTFNLAAGASTTYEFEILSLDETQPGLLVVYADVENDKIASNNSKAIGFGGYTHAANKQKQNSVKVYPNPTTGFITIEVLNNNEEVEMSISDITGKIVVKKHFNSKKKINLSTYQKGLYIINIQSGSGTFIQKVNVL